ncbi:MAG: ATP phosphoribosyltransferase regulatory subunit [Spirochaetota bacterium]
MTERKKKLLQIPQGTESYYLEEALFHRHLTSRLERLYSQWGYLPAQTPVFDFFDIYQPLLKKDNIDFTYRLIDREGDLLMLRSDITLFLAKQMGLTLSENDLPVRVYYADTILRHQDKEDISKNEFFQLGVELIGKSGINADLEILMLLVRSIELLDPACTFIHLGSRALFDAVFTDFSSPQKESLMHAVIDRNMADLARLAVEKLPKEKISEVCTLFQFIGDGKDTQKIFTELKGKGHFSNTELKEIEYLLEIISQLQKLKSDMYFRIDFSEIGNQPYHTGIVFQVYTENADSAVISGGRYDTLLDFFGFNAPSIGFSIFLRKIEPYVGNKARFLPRKQIVTVTGTNFAEMYTKAEEERKKGRITLLE